VRLYGRHKAAEKRSPDRCPICRGWRDRHRIWCVRMSESERADLEEMARAARARLRESCAVDIFTALNATSLPLYHKALITIGVAAAVVGWPKDSE